MRFSKMHALGNDFIVFGTPASRTLPKTDLIRALCDRHYGIGADCAVFIQRSTNCDYFMHVYNPDGFEAEICGNALRCSAKYIFDNGYFSKHNLIVETKSGPRCIKIENDIITAEIGKAHIIEKGSLHLFGITIHYTFVNIGNPHCVVFVPTITDEEFNCLGRTIENHPNFPNGTNVEFASFISDSTISMRVWERGIGETLSCTTGSCACVAAGLDEELCGKRVNVLQPGGIIEVNTQECGNMFVSGECTAVFKGTYLI